MVRVVWNLWGRTMAISGSLCLFFGGASLIFAYQEIWPYLFAYCCVLIALTWFFFLEIFLFNRLGVVRIVVQNFWVNAVGLIAVGVYPLTSFPTLLGGFCYVAAGLMYAGAAVTKEKGKTIAELRKKPGS